MIKYPHPETCKSLSCISYLLQKLFDPKNEADFGSTRHTISKNSSLEEEARQKKKKVQKRGLPTRQHKVYLPRYIPRNIKRGSEKLEMVILLLLFIYIFKHQGPVQF